MKLLIKPSVFSWMDTYNIYDENENPKYFVKNKVFFFLQRIHIQDRNGNEIRLIKQSFSLFMSKFDIEIGGRYLGSLAKRFTLFRPKYNLDYHG